MNRLQTAKQRIIECKLPLKEKMRLLENYQKFEDKCAFFDFNIYDVILDFSKKTQKKKV